MGIKLGNIVSIHVNSFWNTRTIDNVSVLYLGNSARTDQTPLFQEFKQQHIVDVLVYYDSVFDHIFIWSNFYQVFASSTCFTYKYTPHKPGKFSLFSKCFNQCLCLFGVVVVGALVLLTLNSSILTPNNIPFWHFPVSFSLFLILKFHKLYLHWIHPYNIPLMDTSQWTGKTAERTGQQAQNKGCSFTLFDNGNSIFMLFYALYAYPNRIQRPEQKAEEEEEMATITRVV